MPWLDTLAIKNIILSGDESHNLDLTGPGSVDVHLVFGRLKKVADITIITEKNVSVRGVNYGNVKLINTNASGALTLAGNMTMIGGAIDTSEFAGTCVPHGYRYITQPYLDLFAVEDITVTGGVELDFTGSSVVRDEFYVTLADATGNVVINTGRIDTLAGTEFDNTVTVYLDGVLQGHLGLQGDGHIVLLDDVSVESWAKDDTVTIVWNDHELIETGGTSVILSVASFPVDANGIPIFKTSQTAGTPFFAPAGMQDIRFQSDIPLIHVSDAAPVVTSWSSQLPISRSSTVVAATGNDSAVIKTFRNTGAVAFPLNDQMQMVVAVDPGAATIERYDSFMNFAWPLNENGIPIVKVVA